MKTVKFASLTVFLAALAFFASAGIVKAGEVVTPTIDSYYSIFATAANPSESAVVEVRFTKPATISVFVVTAVLTVEAGVDIFLNDVPLENTSWTYNLAYWLVNNTLSVVPGDVIRVVAKSMFADQLTTIRAEFNYFPVEPTPGVIIDDFYFTPTISNVEQSLLFISPVNVTLEVMATIPRDGDFTFGFIRCPKSKSADHLYLLATLPLPTFNWETYGDGNCEKTIQNQTVRVKAGDQIGVMIGNPDPTWENHLVWFWRLKPIFKMYLPVANK